MIKCAIFDLDGTLVYSIDDLGLATDYVLKQYGKEPKWTTDDYRLFVGNGAKKLVERAFEHKLSPAELEKAYEMFKEKYNEILLDHAHLYDGIKEQLDILKQKGIKIANARIQYIPVSRFRIMYRSITSINVHTN